MNKKLEMIIDKIRDEYMWATREFGKFHNAHEGFAVLLEEVDELWENVKLNQSNPGRDKLMLKECIQVATMAIRFIYDCCDVK